MATTQTGLPFQAGSHSSYTGAVASAPYVASQRMRLLRMIEQRGPLTQVSLMRCTGYPINVVSARVRALVLSGLVRAEGYETTKWSSGRTSKRTLWRLTTREEREDFQRTQAGLGL